MAKHSMSSLPILERAGLIRALRQPMPSFGGRDKIGTLIKMPSPHPQADAISPGSPGPDRIMTESFPEGYRPTDQG